MENFCDHTAMDQAVTSLKYYPVHTGACSVQAFEANCCLLFKFNVSLLIITILILFICLLSYLFIFKEDD
jgi:hypothetical protein